ncbi:MAG: 50S ribosomal protein L4 [Candidatus Babeliaceae bacterium]
MISEEKNQEKIAQVITPQDLQLDETNAFSIEPKGLAICIRAQLQNSRQGTVACKNRSAVTSRSNKKPWKQKGTGRARAGSPRSPLWRGGGKAHGPQQRVRQLKVSKSLNRKVLGSLFWEKLQNGQLIVLNDMHNERAHKTAYAYKLLSQAQLHEKKLALFVSVHDQVSHHAFANMPAVRLYLYDQPNAYMLADADYWVFFKKDIDHLKAMVNVWI